MKGWERGLPPGKYYEGMVDDFEVCFTAGGLKWHRRRTAEEKQAHIAMKAANACPSPSISRPNGVAHD